MLFINAFFNNKMLFKFNNKNLEKYIASWKVKKT